MPDTGEVHQVSVGLFSDRDRADRRAESVQKLGLQPEVAERKLPATVFWMDVDLPPGAVSPDRAGTGGRGRRSLPRRSRAMSQPARHAPDYRPAPGTTEPFRTKVAGAAPASKVP